MYELMQITARDYYIECPARMGLVRGEGNGVYLIDSGNDKDAGKKVLRILEGQGWQLKAILNTHSHADHIGGNRFLQEKTGCEIYAMGLERLYAASPVLEPAGLWGGLPFRELRSKFLMAQESRVLPLETFVLPHMLRAIPLPGHCFEMTGFLTEDGTAYIADCVSSPETLEKYGVGYLWDPEAALKTLEALPDLGAGMYVPAHAPVTADIRPLAALNREKLLTLKADILEFCEAPTTFEGLLKRVFDRYGMTMNAQQYALIGSTLRSWLSCLYSRGEVRFAFRDNEMLWQAAQ